MNISDYSKSSLRKDHQIPTGESFREWQTERRLELKQLLGWKIFEPAEPEISIRDIRIENDCRVYNMCIRCEPQVVMPFFLLAPLDAPILTENQFSISGRYPAVIIPHGHLSDGRFGTAGVLRNPAMEGLREQYNHDIGRQFVREGYIALCPDARGSGERRQLPDKKIETLKGSECNDLNNAFISLGSSLAAAWIWDLRILTSWVVSALEPESLSACGFSGGGWQTLLLTALDERIQLAAVSGYFYQPRDCLLTNNLCSCNFIPGFNSYFDHAVLAALCAPRPLFLEKGIDDPLNGQRGIHGVRELVARAKGYYAAAEGILEYREFEGGHRFCGADLYSFFRKQRSGLPLPRINSYTEPDNSL